MNYLVYHGWKNVKKLRGVTEKELREYTQKLLKETTDKKKENK